MQGKSNVTERGRDRSERHADRSGSGNTHTDIPCWPPSGAGLGSGPMATSRDLRRALSGHRAGERWPYLGPPQKRLLIAGISMWVGALLPWVLVLGQSLRAAPLAMSWALWAGLMTLAAASVRWRTIAALSAALGGGGALYLAIWQSTTLFKACLSTDCLPGPGVMLLFGAGILGLLQALKLFRDRPSA